MNTLVKSTLVLLLTQLGDDGNRQYDSEYDSNVDAEGNNFYLFLW